jgi:hypothetical protein
MVFCPVVSDEQHGLASLRSATDESCSSPRTPGAT